MTLLYYSFQTGKVSIGQYCHLMNFKNKIRNLLLIFPNTV